MSSQPQTKTPPSHNKEQLKRSLNNNENTQIQNEEMQSSNGASPAFIGTTIAELPNYKNNGQSSLVIGTWSIQNSTSPTISFIQTSHPPKGQKVVNPCSFDGKEGIQVIDSTPGGTKLNANNAGDFDGDGKLDTLYGNEYVGNAYILNNLEPSATGEIDLAKITEEQGIIFSSPGSGLGNSVDSGHFRGAESSDIVMSSSTYTSPTDPQQCTGRVSVVRGAPNKYPSPFDTAKLNGTDGYNIFLRTNTTCTLRILTVTTIGDVNGDKREEFAIGVGNGRSDGTMQYVVVFGSDEDFPANVFIDQLVDANKAFIIPNLPGKSTINPAGNFGGNGFQGFIVCDTSRECYFVQGRTTYSATFDLNNSKGVITIVNTDDAYIGWSAGALHNSTNVSRSDLFIGTPSLIAPYDRGKLFVFFALDKNIQDGTYYFYNFMNMTGGYVLHDKQSLGVGLGYAATSLSNFRGDGTPALAVSANSFFDISHIGSKIFVMFPDPNDNSHDRDINQYVDGVKGYILDCNSKDTPIEEIENTVTVEEVIEEELTSTKIISIPTKLISNMDPNEIYYTNGNIGVNKNSQNSLSRETLASISAQKNIKSNGANVVSDHNVFPSAMPSSQVADTASNGLSLAAQLTAGVVATTTAVATTPFWSSAIVVGGAVLFGVAVTFGAGYYLYETFKPEEVPDIEANISPMQNPS